MTVTVAAATAAKKTDTSIFSKWLRFLTLMLTTTLISASFQDGEQHKLIYRVIRAQAGNFTQLAALRNIHADTQHELDFWMTPTKVGHKADIMVDDEKIEWLENTLRSQNISYNVIIDDVEKMIIEKEHKSPKLGRHFGKRLNNEGGNRAKYPFGEYHSYSTIVDWLKDIERKYPTRARVFSIGTTHEGRKIQGIKIGKDVGRTDKRIFWIDGGIHAREWAAVHTALYFIERLIADFDDDPLVRAAVEKLNFYIIPVANPDGYEYSRSDVSPMIRLWRKNRAGVVCKKDRWFRDRCCGGVDLNRNFDWFFGTVGSSTDKCSEIYQGSAAFSEAESRAIRDIINSEEMKNKVDGFITLHTYSQMWIHPYSHARKTFPSDINDIERVGRAAVSALENTYGTKYRFGTGSDILYPSSGGSDDWAKGAAQIKYVYLLELRPGEDVWDGFILDQRELIPTAKETWNGVKVVIKAVSDRAPRLSDSVAPSELFPNVWNAAELTSSLPTSTFIFTTAPTTVPTTTTEATTTEAPSTTSTTMMTTTTPIATTSTITSTVPPTTIPSPLTFSTPEPPITTTPTHLDAFYKLGKRRFKFVSIKTFLPPAPTPFWRNVVSTTPAAFTSFPLPLHVTLPAFAPTVSIPNELILEEETDIEGRISQTANSGRMMPAFVRRPTGITSQRTQNVRVRPGGSSFSSQQFIRRNGNVEMTRPAFRTKGASSATSSTANTNVGVRAGAVTSRCADRSLWCGAWLQANQQVCRISSIYMRQDCARTCGFCR